MPEDAPFLLDVTRLIWRRWRGRHPTGIDRVALAYLRHFGPRAQAVVQHERFRRILDFKASQELFSLLEQPGKLFKPALISGALRNVARLKERGNGRIYLNVGHTGLNSDGFVDWVRSADVRPVYFVHDLIPITHPEFCRPGEDSRHRRRMRSVLQTASAIIGNSQATLDELAAFARSEGLAMPPAAPVWLGSDPLPVLSESSEPPRASFVTLGTIEARKNHLLLINIWSRLIDRMGDAAPRLVIIGQRGWEAETVFNALDGNEKLRGHVIELNDCTDRELAGHLRSARALLFPSFTEGFGLPVVEALAAGIPVIASDLPVFTELAGDLLLYLDPRDEPGWERAIVDYADSQSRARAAQIQRLRSFRAPDWQSHFEAVEDWLVKVASSRAAPASS